MAAYLIDHSGHLILFACLLAFSAFFSGSETVLFSLGRHDLKRLEREAQRGARFAVRLLERPRSLLISILFGNLCVNTLMFSIATVLAGGAGRALGAYEATAIAAGGLVLVIVFGEVMPKAIAVHSPPRLAPLVAPPLYLLVKLLAPLAVPMSALVERLTRAMARGAEGDRPLSAPELRRFIELAQRHGQVGGPEGELLKEVLELHDVRVKEVMTPRVDIAAFDLSGDVRGFLDLVRKRRTSKVPVFEGSIDNIIGVIPAKSVVLAENPRAVDLRGLMQKVPFVPETKSVESLLREFVERNLTCAIAVDEYGGTAGLVTLEDVIEAVTGEIRDEFDRDLQPVREIDADRFVLAGDLSLREIADSLGLALRPGGPVTIGGFLAERLGHIPRVGASVRLGDVVLSALRVKRRRVEEVLLEIAPPPGADGVPAPLPASPSPRKTSSGRLLLATAEGEAAASAPRTPAPAPAGAPAPPPSPSPRPRPKTGPDMARLATDLARLAESAEREPPATPGGTPEEPP